MLGQNTFPSSGNVGIGTLTPLSALEIKGDILISNSSIPMGINTEVHGYSPILNMSLNFRETNINKNYIGAAFRIDARSPGLPLFQWLKRDPGEGIEEQVIMNLSQSGNLGIGISQPGERLAVNGNIRAKEIKVETDHWPDYVFKSDYLLQPLIEIKKYINQHGHLPEIPTSATVEKEGINLGEMNRLLLQKIEELTLHLISQDKKVNEMSAELQVIRKLLINK